MSALRKEITVGSACSYLCLCVKLSVSVSLKSLFWDFCDFSSTPGSVEKISGGS